MLKPACLPLVLFLWAASSSAAPLSRNDEAELRALTEQYAEAWVANDRAGVMRPWAQDGVFIPHDGVQPRIGYDKLDAFWFPDGKAVGIVPAYTQTITGISGDDRFATLYGRFDLTWQNSTKRYNWLGNWLIVARKDDGRWFVTHMMASDADPTVTDLQAN